MFENDKFTFKSSFVIKRITVQITFDLFIKSHYKFLQIEADLNEKLRKVVHNFRRQAMARINRAIRVTPRELRPRCG